MRSLTRSFLIIGAILIMLFNLTWAATPLSDERVKEAKQCGIQEVDVKGAKDLIAKGAIILDVREYTEYIAGHIPGALWTPRGLMDFKADEWIPDKDKVYLVYCKTGGRGAIVTCDLKKLGYKNVYNLKGGFDVWIKAGETVEKGEPQGMGKGIKK
ncbi:rhodanese-related sulfurtransferase [Thermodesulfovibrio aggregans]|uniref:Rhodanese-related sulfurtransferase n=1 Tax=Thermodesulfovibrio aggregans TaxID=86166 RepID=A0A0U9HWC0_9BACT|nr:rhodanese-like domain-containing protein [Thermodesulfovibrio aggregans]GAQ95037.1 rhodanese-related sulfurtransferase [Thermodesulfovibrio aggregans]